GAGTRNLVRDQGSIWGWGCTAAEDDQAADDTDYTEHKWAADYTDDAVYTEARNHDHVPEWEDLRVPLEPLPPKCPRCGGLARPGVVWFGESIPAPAARAAQAAAACDVVLSISTSAVVYPAARLVAPAKARRHL